ncbi:MAG: hypothetical protein GEU99_06660 [Luteitalea sp.]|nr:hypothetical protein [Luteitalea sp.]
MRPSERCWANIAFHEAYHLRQTGSAAANVHAPTMTSVTKGKSSMARRTMNSNRYTIWKAHHPRRRRLGPLVSSVVGVAMGAALLSQVTVAQAPELGQGWLPEFNLAARQLVELADATPAEKFSWRPAAGVRSIGEVYVHVAVGNFWLLEQAGVKIPGGLSKVPEDPEKSITDKAEVIKWLQESLDAVRTSYPSADRQKKVQFLGQETTSDFVLLRVLVHNHEHMGQAIAYARMNGIVPPWSTASAE